MTRVRDIMGQNVVTISADSSALDAARLLRDKDISFVVTISDKDIPLGIVTERDIVRKIAAEDRQASEFSVSEIQSTTFLSAEPSTKIEVAVQKMMNARIRRLVVLENGRLVGVITQTDLAGFLRNKLLIDGTIAKSD